MNNRMRFDHEDKEIMRYRRREFVIFKFCPHISSVMSSTKANPIPKGYETITPHLIVKNAGEAIEFYKKAFGAEEQYRHTLPDGKSIMHAALKINNSVLMIVDDLPDLCGANCGSPSSIGRTSVFLHVYVEDVDKLFDQAQAAGATVRLPLMDAFWGDRYGQLIDPYGHIWEVATHKKDMSTEEIERAAREVFAKNVYKEIKLDC